MKNLPIYDLNVNKLIRSYFNLYFNHKVLINKYISPRKRRLSLNRIFVSKAEIKHTNSKAIITIYTYNREKISLLKKIRKLKIFLFKNILKIIFDFSKIIQKYMIKLTNNIVPPIKFKEIYNKFSKFILHKQ
jgi:hypothetical protein